MACFIEWRNTIHSRKKKVSLLLLNMEQIGEDCEKHLFNIVGRAGKGNKTLGVK